MWYHHDRLGSTAYLTDNVVGSVESFVSYDDWGAPTMKSIIRLGSRDIDLVTNYTGHPYDPVLGVYYARARMYDAADRRFMAVDPFKGTTVSAITLVQYVYCLDNPLKYVDPTGLAASVNPLEILSNLSSFRSVEKITDDGYDYYHIGGVMEVLGGTADYDKKSNSTTLSLTYNGITANIVYCMNDVPRQSYWIFFTKAIDNSIFEATGTYTENRVTRRIEGTLPILYNSKKTYVNLYDLDFYFSKIWCADVIEDSPPPTPTPTPPITTQILNPSPMLEAFLKDYEQCLLESYDANPPNGDWTIGWGHKLSEYSGNRNNPNITWTQARADSTFVSDLDRMINATFVPFLVSNNISLSQNQFDAMASFTYNYGQNTWSPTSSYDTIKNFILVGDYSEGATRIAFSMYMGSRQPAGLIARRNDEIEMFLYGDYSRDYDYTRP